MKRASKPKPSKKDTRGTTYDRPNHHRLQSPRDPRHATNHLLHGRSRPTADDEAYVLLFEPKTVVNTGDTQSNFTIQPKDLEQI